MRTEASRVLLACALASSVAAPGCGHHAETPTSAASDARPVTSDARLAVASATDAGSANAAAVDAGPHFTPPTQIIALGTWVPVRREPHRDAPLVGYLRAGAIAAVDGMPHGREHCPARRDDPSGGWYHLVGGGFTCVGGALAVAWPSRGVLRPAQPQLDAGMPYQYAAVYGTPIMYRAPPTMDELRIYEPWRFHHDDDGGEGGTDDAAVASANDPGTNDNAANAGSGDSTESDDTAATSANGHHDRHHGSATATADNAPPPPGPPPTNSDDTPNGEPRLRDLRGDRSGPVIRRLLRGMYVALDRSILSRSTGDRYWRTQSGGFVRTGPLGILHTVPTFRGVLLDGQHTLPFAFMVSPHGWNYRLSASGRSASRHDSVPRLTAIQLTADPPVAIGNDTYYRTSDGLAVEARNVRIATLRPPPDGVGEHEKWIDIDLDGQILVAYEGAVPVFVTLVSTGRRATDEAERFETPAGSFRIHGKHITTTMDGDTANAGPYSIEDVPWAEYFYESYAIHGAFWHGNFGWRMSHGCVNLSPSDAQWLFFWTEPQLPPGWHGVFETPEHPGTRVELHHGNQRTPRRPTI